MEITRCDRLIHSDGDHKMWGSMVTSSINKALDDDLGKLRRMLSAVEDFTD